VWERRYQEGTVLALTDIGFLLVLERNERNAALLWGAVEALVESTGSQTGLVEHVKHDREVLLAQALIKQGALAAAWAEGREMSLEQAVELALKVWSP
jgi:hypothetical protein